MERGALAGLPGRGLRHRAAHLAGERVRVPGQRDERGDRQPVREQHLHRAVAPLAQSPALGQQQPRVQLPRGRQFALRRGERVPADLGAAGGLGSGGLGGTGFGGTGGAGARRPSSARSQARALVAASTRAAASPTAA